ncbi:hypothetical protein SISNIDRAFT_489812 [Sistotremastrum niveocremeum HHB9708]|uniref:Uncharacterized protein n=1 Tax=Sistotremastrum niveocremeum HHB9708 TaxID=1314777 RepID=A0A164PJ30_9AGAM|nr:hypothetical protein SISNIDRAFT_489812 [Sistotremastrum niveocremeum HHB9708]
MDHRAYDPTYDDTDWVNEFICEDLETDVPLTYNHHDPLTVDAPGADSTPSLSNSHALLSSPVHPHTPSQLASPSVDPTYAVEMYPPEFSSASMELPVSIPYYSGYTGHAVVPLPSSAGPGTSATPKMDGGFYPSPPGMRHSEHWEHGPGPLITPTPAFHHLATPHGRASIPPTSWAFYPAHPTLSNPSMDMRPPHAPQPSSLGFESQLPRGTKRKASSPPEGESTNTSSHKRKCVEADASEAGPSTPRRGDSPAAINSISPFPFPLSTASSLPAHHGPPPLVGPTFGSSGPPYNPHILSQFHGDIPGPLPRPSTSRSPQRPVSGPPSTPVASTSRLSHIPSTLPHPSMASARHSTAVPDLETIPSTTGESSTSCLRNNPTLASALPAETVPEAVVGPPSAPVPGIPLLTAGHISVWYTPSNVPPTTSANPPSSFPPAGPQEVLPKESDDHSSEGTKPRKDKGKGKAKAVDEEVKADEEEVAEEEVKADAHDEGVPTPNWPDVSPEWPMEFTHNEEDGQTGPQDRVRKPPDDKVKAFTHPPKRALPCHATQRSKKDTQAELRRLYITSEGTKKKRFFCKYQNPYTGTITERDFGTLDSALRHLHARYRRDRHYIDQRWILREQSHLVNIYHYCPELVAKALSLACEHPDCQNLPPSLSRDDAYRRHQSSVHGVVFPDEEGATKSKKGSAAKTQKAATTKTKNASSTKTKAPASKSSKKSTKPPGKEPVASSSERKLDDIDSDDDDDGGEYQGKSKKRQRKT